VTSVLSEPTKMEFLRRADAEPGATVVPVSCELMADLETTISAYLKLRDLPSSFLLESVEGSAQVARFSALGGAPRYVLASDGARVTRTDAAGATHQEAGEPLAVVAEHLARYRARRQPGLPPVTGGFVGYLAYDAVRLWERLPHRPPDDLGLPVFRLALMDTVVVFDHLRHTLRVIANAFLDEDGAEVGYQRARERIDAVLTRLAAPRPAEPAPAAPPLAPRASVTPEAYCAAVERAQEHIRAGDIYQVILSQRVATPVPGLDPLSIYRTLRVINPSPYMFLLDLGGAALVGSSPERLVRLEDGRIDMRPLAGTRPRGSTPEADRAVAEALLADPKERAEHVMLVDLTRNDVGRVARYGSVRVSELLAVERYSHVMHLVSHVEGALAPGRTAWDVLQAVFPHGTVSGAPKVRAMEIIDALEPVARGPYAGCVGYLGFDGSLNTAITIRTVVVKDGTAYVQAGAGIVADSVPEKEHEECVAKARALVAAIERAGRPAAAAGR
jgi:anthranilate synthase component 1